MFDVGFWELAILFGLGLIVLGPEKLPRVASQLGNWAGQARRMARNLSAQMQAEVDLNDPFKKTPPAKKTPQEVKPAWQTSAGLRPGYSSENEAANEAPSEDPSEDELPEESGHQEYDPATDPDHAAANSDDDTDTDTDTDTPSDKTQA